MNNTHNVSTESTLRESLRHDLWKYYTSCEAVVELLSHIADSFEDNKTRVELLHGAMHLLAGLSGKLKAGYGRLEE